MNSLRGGVGREGSEGGLLILPVPPPLLNTGRNWHRGPQIQCCASNLILCLIEKEGPRSYSIHHNLPDLEAHPQR